ncbi:MAG: hypothetical protein Q9203_002567 [Teloschistes exilis]
MLTLRLKSDFYKVLMPYTKAGSSLPAVFNTRDEALHKQIKSPIAPLYSLSNTISYEVHVDQVLDVMFNQLDSRFVETEQTFDLGNWLQYFAFDVMGTLTFSKRYGLLEQGHDVNGMLETIWNFMIDAAPFTQIPWLDDWWRKNSVAVALRGSLGISFLKIVSDCIDERQQRKGDKERGESGSKAKDRDMLSSFLEVAETNRAPTAWTFSNIIAGSDSTAVVLKTILYNLLAHPLTLQRLHDELVAMDDEQKSTRPWPTWAEVRDLPYLEACIQEGVRLHPPFCLPLERVVPKEGITIGEHTFPGGTVVGMSPWVVNRHQPTFGEDADSWRPERWLGLDAEHHKQLENSKHIAMLELKKLVSALILTYEFELIDPNAFTVENSWFFRQNGLNVKAKKR